VSNTGRKKFTHFIVQSTAVEKRRQKAIHDNLATLLVWISFFLVPERESGIIKFSCVS